MATKSQSTNENAGEQRKSFVTPEQWAKIWATIKHYYPVVMNVIFIVILGTLIAMIFAIKVGSKNRQ